MAAGHFRCVGIAAQCRANALHLVCGHGNADARGANQYAVISLAVCHAVRDLCAVHRIVHAVRGIAAEVFDFDALCFQMLLDGFFQSESAVIRTNCDLHAVFSFVYGLLIVFLCVFGFQFALRLRQTQVDWHQSVRRDRLSVFNHLLRRHGNAGGTLKAKLRL